MSGGTGHRCIGAGNNSRWDTGRRGPGTTHPPHPQELRQHRAAQRNGRPRLYSLQKQRALQDRTRDIPHHNEGGGETRVTWDMDESPMRVRPHGQLTGHDRRRQGSSEHE